MAKLSETISKYLELRRKIQSKQFSPVYLLHGEEVYFIDALTDLLENTIIPVSERSFNQTLVYGKEVKIHDLIAMARRYPMMSEHQVIIVKDAQDIKDFDKLLGYLVNPLPSTVLICAFRGSKLDMRTKLGKQADQFGGTYLAAKLRDYQIKEWLPEYFKQQGRSVDGAALQMILDLLGADLPLIHNELDKLFINVKDEFIRTTHVESHIGFNREYNVFELQSALGVKNFNKAIQIAHHVSNRAEKGDILRVVSNLNTYFGKVLILQQMGSVNKSQVASALGVNIYFVDEYMTAAKYYSFSDMERVFNQIKLLDLRLKGVIKGSATDGELLIEAIVGILRAPQRV